jgi:hypothetical protein
MVCIRASRSDQRERIRIAKDISGSDDCDCKQQNRFLRCGTVYFESCLIPTVRGKLTASVFGIVNLKYEVQLVPPKRLPTYTKLYTRIKLK